MPRPTSWYCSAAQCAVLLSALSALSGCISGGAAAPAGAHGSAAGDRSARILASIARSALPARPKGDMAGVSDAPGPDGRATSVAGASVDRSDGAAAKSAGAQDEAWWADVASIRNEAPAIDEGPSRGRCPAEMALVDDRVCVDRWEGSLVARIPGQGERPWSPYEPVDGNEDLVRAVSRPGVVPQGYISGQQAQLACNASGKRLCRAGEWERACRGPRNTTFPYGDARRPGACNDDVREVHPVAEAGAWAGLSPKDLWRDGMNLPLINQLPSSLLRTGSRPSCTNELGVYDMVGNLHEWVDDPDGTFRGGYYMDTTRNGDGCSYDTTAHDFRYHDYSTGFRCCMDPDHVE